MAETGLSSGEKRRGKRDYQIFQPFNVLSFTMLSGSVLTLYSLKLGVSNVFIGLISSMVYLAFLFMIVGRFTIRTVGIKRQFGISWLLRNLVMVPVVFAPLAEASGRHGLMVALILLPFFGFNLFKGIGLVSVNPTIGALAEGKDRGAFLARLQINVQAMLIVTNLIIAFYLGPDAPLGRYVVLILAGIAAGIVSTIFIFRLPEPPAAATRERSGLFADFGKSLRRPDFRAFIVLAFIVSVITGMAGPFIVVYAKQVYGVADNIVVFFLVVGNLGAVAMGYFARKVIDRLGAKPLYFIFFGVLGVSMAPILVSPRLDMVGARVFLAVLFFLFNFGLVGGANTGQSYFFAITNAAEHMNLGILYNVVSGVGGALGSFLAGSLLGVFESMFARPAFSFRLMYGVVLALVAAGFPLLARLKNDGRFSVRHALEIFLSRKDLKAVALLQKLDTSATVRDEAAVIDSLGNLDSTVPVEDLLAKTHSPRFYIRSRALRALENLPPDRRITDTLISEVRNHPYTTSYIAARILGRRGSVEAVSVLRRSLGSPDYLLQGEAALALARLGDRSSISRIEAILESSDNPLVQIYAASALEILRSTGSVPALLRALRRRDPPPYLRDEIILSIAGVTGMGDWFYPLYSEFLERGRGGVAALLSALKDCGVAPETGRMLAEAITSMLKSRESFGERIAEFFNRCTGISGGIGANVVPELAAAARETGLLRFDRFAFLLAATAVHLACRHAAQVDVDG